MHKENFKVLAGVLALPRLALPGHAELRPPIPILTIGCHPPKSIPGHPFFQAFCCLSVSDPCSRGHWSPWLGGLGAREALSKPEDQPD